MIGMNYCVPLTIAGTLSGTTTRVYVMPFNATLRSVQVSAGANTDSELDVGTSTDGDAWIDGVALGASGAPVIVKSSSFIGGLPIQVAEGDTISISVTKGGTAAANVTVYLNFTEG